MSTRARRVARSSAPRRCTATSAPWTRGPTAYGPSGVRCTARSHGEGFLAFLEERTTERGLWILDEPESALSFRSCLRLLALLDGVVAAGSQVLLATHSPLLAALPGALVYELHGSGFSAREWADLELVQDWRMFLDDPGRLLHHLLDE